MKRKDIKFKELLKNDLDAAEIFNKAIELADIRHRHYYYSEEFLNQTLAEKIWIGLYLVDLFKY